jgi:undecaprenyl-diphosphatase
MPGWIQEIDDQLLQWFQEQHTRFLDYNLNNVTALGSTTVLALVLLLALGTLLLAGQCKKAILTVIVIVGAYLATDEIKYHVARHRPVLAPVAKAKVDARAKTDSPSFPSSHASLSMAVFLTLALCLRPPARSGQRSWIFTYAVLGALALASLVGVSRLYLGKHFLSDVAGGWLLGLVFALIFYLADRLTERAS